MLLVLPLPVQAATSDWVTSEGGRMRLIALPPDADGRSQAGLQIEPRPGWFTYWREPGDAGIPPQLTPAAGTDLRLSPLRFPVPRTLDLNGLRDIGYDAPVVLPFTIETTAARVTLQAFIGLCDRICIPLQGEMTVALAPGTPARSTAGKAPQSRPGQGGNEAAVLLADAAAALPAPPGPDFAVAGVQLSRDGQRLDLSLRLPAGVNLAQLLVTGPEGYVVSRFQAGVRSEGAADLLPVQLELPKLPRAGQAVARPWQVLAVTADGRAMEAPLAFPPGTPIVQP